jgi:hypothetical protein
MQKDLLTVNQKIIINSGVGGVDQSFQDIPKDKYALIELISFRLEEQENTQDQPEPLILWAYPAQKGPPRTKSVYFPLHKYSSESPFFADTHSIKLRLEPGDAWGVSLYRKNTTGTSELSIYLSGYFYAPMRDKH